MPQKTPNKPATVDYSCYAAVRNNCDTISAVAFFVADKSADVIFTVNCYVIGATTLNDTIIIDVPYQRSNLAITGYIGFNEVDT